VAVANGVAVGPTVEVGVGAGVELGGSGVGSGFADEQLISSSNANIVIDPKIDHRTGDRELIVAEFLVSEVDSFAGYMSVKDNHRLYALVADHRVGSALRKMPNGYCENNGVTKHNPQVR